MILEGVRVLSFTTGIAGPNAGRILACLGAEVIKVESVRGGIDSFRYFGTGDDLNSSARFAEANIGVRSLTVNLKHPGGPEIIRKLVPHCDVVLDNYRSEVLGKLGLGYDELRKCRPDIIVVKMSGLGSSGPMSGYGTWGALLTAYSGLTWLWNHRDATVPVGNQGVFPDYVSSVLGPMTVVAALLHREATGTGCLVDLAQSEATAFCALPQSLLEVNINGTDPEVVGNRSRGEEVQGVYPCAGTDRWCAVRVETDGQLAALFQLIGPPGDGFGTLAAARQEQDAVDAMIASWTSRRSARDAMEILQARGIPAGLVASGDDLLADPQLNRDGFIRRFEQPGVGEMVIPGLPVKIAPNLVEEPAAASALGQDNEYVLKGILGMSDAEIDRAAKADILS